MEEKKAKNNNGIMEFNNKLEWEIPKLYSLDKGKTEGGDDISYTEDFEGRIS